MTKGERIAQFQLALGIQFMSRVIASYIDDSFNTVVGQLFKSNPNQYDFYCKTYILDVKHEKPHPYAMLPVKIIQTPDNANGVRRIFSLEEDDLNFVPIPDFWFQMNKKLIAGRVSKQIGYSVKPNMVEFEKLPSEVEQVRAELVRPFSAYDNDEEVPLPDGSADLIVQRVLAMMNKEPVKENIYK